ncbi:rCG63394 [Rattus norvegicus]|uniref:RCG63394 n=1 Tax=Rattus norvegicus TaxID=10116 RepID=A6J5T3_RAT|nr:rCG63394 [Rattus norvegicus]
MHQAGFSCVLVDRLSPPRLDYHMEGLCIPLPWSLIWIHSLQFRMCKNCLKDCWELP